MDPASEFVLIDQHDRDLLHNGGGMFFGPDGFLYLSLGDEGKWSDHYGNAQRVDGSLFSGVIRIDVDCGPVRSHPIPRQPLNGKTQGYFIPNDNPWVGRPDTLEEFWAIGLREPHRMTFDPATETVWVGDVGQDSWEEIDVIEKGGNYQWPWFEGTHGGAKLKPGEILGIEKPPVLDYGRDVGKCVIGGYVYRGSRYPELTGKYVYGDNESGDVFALSWDPQSNRALGQEVLCRMPGVGQSGLSSFAVDVEGELYLLKVGYEDGGIYKLARTGTAGESLPKTLSATGAFADVRNLIPATGLIPYEINVPFWSDGAEKRRWIALPNDGPPYDEKETIAFGEQEEWSFPRGTVFVKHFELPTGNGPMRIETRVLVLSGNGQAHGASYRWREDSSDADLVTVATVGNISLESGDQPWYFPGPADCLSCHTAAAGRVLGVNTRQMNRVLDSSPENQLATWARREMFYGPAATTQSALLPRLHRLEESDVPLEVRVRSYLDANCGYCHRPGGASTNFDLRFSPTASASDLIGAPPRSDLGTPGAALIVPGQPELSVLHLRSRARTVEGMPPLGSLRVDDAAVQAVAEWIELLPAGRSTRMTDATGTLPWMVTAAAVGAAGCYSWIRRRRTLGK